jgi:hypothetical protein
MGIILAVTTLCSQISPQPDQSKTHTQLAVRAHEAINTLACKAPVVWHNIHTLSSIETGLSVGPVHAVIAIVACCQKALSVLGNKVRACRSPVLRRNLHNLLSRLHA